MNKEEATRLVNRGMTVILSCETTDQLKTATTYADLIYRKLAREIGLINHTQFISLIERSIGFAQCKVKYNVKSLKA
jgi:hypothetical protein